MPASNSLFSTTRDSNIEDKFAMSNRKDKIAIIIIHGIGDQRPLATLRSFVEALLHDDKQPSNQPTYWSKPDTFSQSLDLRRYQARAGRERPPLDFYEYYWANKMEGNAVSHSIQWVTNLLLRLPSSVPPGLRNLWWLCWAVIAIVLPLAIYFWTWKPAAVTGLVIALFLGLAKLGIETGIRDWIGDAARYFDDRPVNIGVREAIRRGGIDLLEKIHDSGDYSRVIVVGHSLGSAIALDMLYHSWIRTRERHGGVDRPDQTHLFKLEELIKRKEKASVAEIREQQKHVWQEMQANGYRWRVTDLITLGSPLAHLPFLTRLDEAQFLQRLFQRELPMCPPVLDGKRIAYPTQYRTESGEERSIATLHHAACFAPTRWTNIYFPHDGWFGGDPIGGPLQSLFGYGIEDRNVETRHWGGKLNHLDYWRKDPRDCGQDRAPLETLHASLCLDEDFSPS